MSDNEEPAPGASEQLTIRIKDQVRGDIDSGTD